MNILFVLDIGFDRGGPSVHLLESIIDQSLSGNDEVDVILKDTGGHLPKMPDELKIKSNLRYHLIKDSNERTKGFIQRYLAEIVYAYKCSNVFLSGKNYDVVFLQSNTVAFFYMRLLKRLKCKIVFNVQDIFPYNLMMSNQMPLKKVLFPIFRWLQNKAYQSSDRIVTISEDMKNTLVKDGVDPKKIDVVYNWSYDDADITLAQIDENNIYRYIQDASVINVVYAGNIGKMQNVELIAQAALINATECDIHFYIIGDGPNKRNIVELTQGLSNVTILPMQDAKFAESIYVQADVNIIPLATGGVFTALPSKTATCLRTNKPLVFCIDEDSILYKKLVDDNRVTATNCKDPNKLLEAIRSVASARKKNGQSSEELRKNMSVNNAKKYAEIIKKTGEQSN